MTAVHFRDGGRLCARHIDLRFADARTDTLAEALLDRIRATLYRHRGAIIPRCDWHCRVFTVVTHDVLLSGQSDARRING